MGIPSRWVIDSRTLGGVVAMGYFEADAQEGHNGENPWEFGNRKSKKAKTK